MGGHDLVALIFAREVSDSLTSLVKTIDKQLQESTARRTGGNRLGVFVVVCSDDPGLKGDLPQCDCEVLVDRTYFLPLGDLSWPDDTLIEFEYMDGDQ